MFTRVRKIETVVDVCFTQLREAILSGSVEVGARLPPERKLAQTLGVNRVTLRSALARLQVSGLVRVRQGSGYLVEDYRSSGGPELIGPLVAMAEGPGALAELAEELLLVRRQMARIVLERLSAGVDDAAISIIERRVDEFQKAVEEDASTGELALRDLAVFRALVNATGSTVFALFMNPVTRLLGEFEQLQEAIYSDGEQSLMAYRHLILWLRLDQRKPVDLIMQLMAARDAMTVDRIRGGS
jgi:GntR family transcriptional repressor for pyruvate dehydrogenase complex